MKYVYSILILALLSGAATAQVDSTKIAAEWANKAVEWKNKWLSLQGAKDAWAANGDSSVIYVPHKDNPHQFIAIKTGNNAVTRNSLSDSVTAFKAHEKAAKDSTKAYSNGAK